MTLAWPIEEDQEILQEKEILFPSELLWADSIAWVAYPFPRSLANFVIE
jgi:hypothetical protein